MQIKQLESKFNKCSLHIYFLHSMGIVLWGTKKRYNNNKITTVHWTVTELTPSIQLVFVYVLHSTYEI